MTAKRMISGDVLKYKNGFFIPGRYGTCFWRSRNFPQTLPSVALVVVGHGAETPLLHWQARLAAVERLGLAFLIDGQDDGVSR